MEIKDKCLFLDLSIAHNELNDLAQEVLSKIEQFDKVSVVSKEVLLTSGFISLLMSLKETKKELEIDLVDSPMQIQGLGFVTCIKKQ